jgi:hypothetical protein
MSDLFGKKTSFRPIIRKQHQTKHLNQPSHAKIQNHGRDQFKSECVPKSDQFKRLIENGEHFRCGSKGYKSNSENTVQKGLVLEKTLPERLSLIFRVLAIPYCFDKWFLAGERNFAAIS